MSQSPESWPPVQPPVIVSKPVDKGQPTRVSGQAVASLVLGLLSFILFLLAGIPAIILGILALGKIRDSRGALSGKGMAVAGIATGSLGMAVSLPLILVAMLLPAVAQVREAARRTDSANRLRQLILAAHNYHDATETLPPAYSTDEKGKPLLSWRVHLLPYMEEEELFAQFHLDEPWDSPHNRQLIDQMPEVYQHPKLELTPGYTNFLAVTGEDTAMVAPRSFGETRFPRGLALAEIPDGSARSIIMIEVNAEHAVFWTKPSDFDAGVSHKELIEQVKGVFNTGFNTGFADGSIHNLSFQIPPDTLYQLLHISDGGNPIDY